MKTYSVYFNGMWQGDYKAHNWYSAMHDYFKHYGISSEDHDSWFDMSSTNYTVL